MTKIFSIWRFVISLGLAKSGLWCTTTEKNQRVYIFSIHILKQDDNSALNILIGPFSIIIGYRTVGEYK